MNFPVGEVPDRGDVPLDIVAKVGELSSMRFNGYLVIAVRGQFVEEGILFFREGEIIACIVECLAIEKTFKGKDALEFFFNQTKGFGYFQCVSLSKSQVDLVTAFDEKLLLGSKIDLKDIPKLLPSAFSPKFYRLPSQKSTLDVFGLGDLK
ncbi:MAG: hypothetical protein NTY48_05030 [Candidatus Diapherotrites archaeon]|nr:hypothetical protein [Candidatus Diapherotrites archaeon]